MGFAEALARGDAALRAQLKGNASITYSPGTGAPVVVTGIFDQAYRLLDQEQPGVSTTSPAVFLGLVDLPSDPTSDLAATVTVGGTQYRIKEPKPDGVGGVVLLLREV